MPLEHVKVQHEAGRSERVSAPTGPRPSTFHRKAEDMSKHTTGRKPARRTLKQRALAIIDSKAHDAETRAILRYAVEVEDPTLSELVRRAETGDTILDTVNIPGLQRNHRELSRQDAQILAKIICSDDHDPGNRSAALLVLMAALETSAKPKDTCYVIKQFAFARCGELNLFGMVDAQVELLQGELLGGTL